MCCELKCRLVTELVSDGFPVTPTDSNLSLFVTSSPSEYAQM